jgi:putative oxidoreductase
MSPSGVDIQTLSIGLLLIRLVIGFVMAAHGTQKLFGWFGGYGLNKTGEFFVHLGFEQGRAFAAAASLTEIASGLLVVFGFLGPIGPALMISVMIVAMITVHWEHGLFATNNGIEVPLLYATAALGLALIGFGAYSLDAWLGITDRWTPTITAVVLGAGVVGALGNVAIRHRATPLEATSANRH